MKLVFSVKGLDCANCAAKLERKIGKLTGVENASVNFFLEKITAECAEEDAAALEAQIIKTAGKVEPEAVVKRL